MPRPLGQHFLHDPAVLDRIVDALDPQPHDRVLEIGPGGGTLTRRLASRVGVVVAIEKDRGLFLELREASSGKRETGDVFPDNVTVVQGDALTADWHALIAQPPAASPSPHPASSIQHPAYKVAGNIPYYITSPLIDKALTPPRPTVVVFLVQKEVADRVTSAPGSKIYGALSVGVQVIARAERLFTVKAGTFNPPPAVDAAVLRLRPRDAPLIDDAEQAAFRSFVTALFGQRRRQLVRGLRTVAGVGREEAARLLEALGIDLAARPEVLSPSAFVSLYRALGR